MVMIAAIYLLSSLVWANNQVCNSVAWYSGYQSLNIVYTAAYTSANFELVGGGMA